ncbi:MAG: hypothetical protein C4562_03370 [Actinobacteria bacterium]|nr:MAG: hypothetical protein C4562_03370 [Actinomycetota bacterium]
MHLKKLGLVIILIALSLILFSNPSYGLGSGSITGKVNNASGQAIEEIEVTIFDSNREPLDTQFTDFFGNYTFTDLADGNYKIKFIDYTGYYAIKFYQNSNCLEEANSISLSNGSSLSINNSILEPASLIKGVVTDNAGLPVENVEISAFDLNGHYISSGYSESNGSYEISALPSGDYKVLFLADSYAYEYYNDKSDFTSASSVHLNSTQELENINAELEVPSQIIGKVTNNIDQPLEYIEVGLFDANSTYLFSTSTDSQGNYQLNGLRNGNYKLRFYDDAQVYKTKYYKASQTIENADLINVSTQVVTADDTKLFIINNQKPTAIINLITPNPAFQKQGVAFDGMGNDIDGIIREYSWRSSIDGQLSNQASFNTSTLSVGAHTIYFKVRDSEGEWSDEASSTLEVINQAPTATINLISPNPANQGDNISFGGSGLDTDGSITEYYWRSSINGPLSNQKDFAINNLPPGLHTIYFKVRDNDGAFSDEVSAIIDINQKPVALINYLNPTTAHVDTPIFFEALGIDDGSIVEYSWRSSMGETLPSLRMFSVGDLLIGLHTIYLKVKDNKGAWSDEVSANLEIQPPNQPPTAVIDLASPETVNEAEAVYFSGHGDDSDGSIAEYSWRSSIDDDLSDEKSFDTDYLSPGQHTIYFKVKDDDGLWSSEAETEVTVIAQTNKKPTAKIESVTPNPAIQGQGVSFIGSANDEDGDIDEYIWTSSVDGELSRAISFNANNLSIGPHVIKFIAIDDEGASSDEATQALVVIALPVLSPTPSAPAPNINPINPSPAIKVLGTRLSIAAKKYVIKAGQKTVIKGQLKNSNGRALANKGINFKAKALRIIKKKVNGRTIRAKEWVWRVIAKAKTNSKGVFAKAIRFRKTTTIKAVFAGEQRFKASNSKAIKVKVKK